MSRNTIILLVVLCAAVAGLVVFSKMRSGQISTATQTATRETTIVNTESTKRGGTAPFHSVRPAQNSQNPAPVLHTVGTNPPSTVTLNQTPVQPSNRTGIVAVPVTHVEPDSNLVPDIKPLPVLEKDYATATNRDVRLDIMMDIAEVPGPESVKALTRLFEAETDTDLKVDLLDSLLGIEGFKEEKLIMLTMGARQGLPTEIRQSAIDGLIDLDDQRVIPVLNGLLNDPEEEIREGAKDALEMIQSPPVLKVK